MTRLCERGLLGVMEQSVRVLSQRHVSDGSFSSRVLYVSSGSPFEES